MDLVLRPKVHVISLRRLPERAARVSSRLSTLGIAHELFPAVDGSLAENLAWEQYDQAACIRRFGSSLLPSEIGCFASHFSLWQRCAQEGVPFLVLEDDVTLLDIFPCMAELAGARIQSRRLIRLSGLFDEPFRIVEDMGDATLARFLKGPMGSQAYMLSPEGAKALVEAASVWDEPLDHFLDRFWAHGVLPYAILPFAALQEEEAERASTIGVRTKRRKGWKKFNREFNRLRDRFSRRVYNLRH